MILDARNSKDLECYTHLGMGVWSLEKNIYTLHFYLTYKLDQSQTSSLR